MCNDRCTYIWPRFKLCILYGKKRVKCYGCLLFYFMNVHIQVHVFNKFSTDILFQLDSQWPSSGRCRVKGRPDLWLWGKKSFLQENRAKFSLTVKVNKLNLHQLLIWKKQSSKVPNSTGNLSIHLKMITAVCNWNTLMPVPSLKNVVGTRQKPVHPGFSLKNHKTCIFCTFVALGGFYRCAEENSWWVSSLL